MRFELDVENFHILMELTRTPDYRPDGKFSQVSQEERELWQKGKLSFYSIVITSQSTDKDFIHQDPLIHYTCGLLLPEDPQELQEDLEVILDEEGLLEHVFTHWDLITGEDGPQWRK